MVIMGATVIIFQKLSQYQHVIYQITRLVTHRVKKYIQSNLFALLILPYGSDYLQINALPVLKLCFSVKPVLLE